MFIDPATLRLTGVIDFGDAYLSHPALDLRRWGQPADRKALIAGYSTAGIPLSESFHANWRAISVAALMQDFATRPSRRAESLGALLALHLGSIRKAAPVYLADHPHSLSIAQHEFAVL